MVDAFVTLPDASSPSEVCTIAATLRAFVEGTGALRAVLLLDRENGAAPLMIDVSAGGVVETTEGEQSRALDGSEAVLAASLELPELRAFGAMDLDVQAGTLSGPLGALDHVGRAVRDTAALFPGRSVLTVGFETSDPETPLFLAARRGEPMVLVLGDAQYELPAGFPAG